MSFDFIIIGSGLAGLTSALILKDYGRVLIITKGKLSDSATNLAQGGIAAVVEEGDSFESHINDTMIAGAYHNNKKAVEYAVRNAPEAIRWLSDMGVKFATKDGNWNPTREAAHSYPRVLHSSDFTGREIEKALIQKVRNEKKIHIWENCYVTDILVENKTCFGVKLLSSRVPIQSGRGDLYRLLRCVYTVSARNDIVVCFSRVVILATGGLGQIYQWTTNPEVAIGDGVALAYRAGAKVKDMEFIQFHPTALKPACRQAGNGNSPLFLLSEALRGEGAYLVKRNALKHLKGGRMDSFQVKESINPCMVGMQKGERFMGDYDKRLELAPRDVVARAISSEQKKGYEVYLDIRHKGEEFLKNRFPNIYKKLKSRGLNLTKDLIPVTPAAHYSCGGVEVDLFGRTNIRNLFAFGEVACTSLHGVNRLASNSLLEAVVFPLRLKDCFSGLPDSIYSSSDPDITSGESRSFIRNGSRQVYLEQGREARTIRKNLQHLMWEKVGIVRTRKGLKEALQELVLWEKELIKNKRLNKEYLELRNMIQAAKLIVEACISRSQSLGTHFID